MIKKGDRVKTSGLGVTRGWKEHTGTVTMKRKNSVFVVWDNTHFEDERNVVEVLKIKKGEPQC